MADLQEVRMDVDKASLPKANGAGTSGNGSAAANTITEAELAAMGYVKASSQQTAAAPMEFSGGLLPASAQADTYEDKTKARACAALRWE
jgi:hypothetical protein